MIEPNLTALLGDALPSARIEAQALPEVPGMQLYLLNDDYPQEGLSAQAIRHLMDNPMYWVFCWASGLVLSRFILEQPAWVRGKRVLDFGAGSGVVAVAAARAGASEVIACDLDDHALAACRANAELNGVEMTLERDYFAVAGDIDLIIVADVLYDRENLVWLERFIDRAPAVLVADSRIKDFDFPRYRRIAREEASTIPDLDESAEFRSVSLYLGKREGQFS